MVKCCDITAGELRESITIQKQVEVPGSMGGQELTWEDRFAARAGIKMMSGREQLQHDKLEVRATHKFTIRFNSTIIESDRIVHVKNGKTEWFDIKSIDNVEYRNKWMLIVADRGGPS